MGRFTRVCILLALLLGLCGCAAAERHMASFPLTAVQHDTDWVGNLERDVRTFSWQLEEPELFRELLASPGFSLSAASLRFTARSVHGTGIAYQASAGELTDEGRVIWEGRNLRDVTALMPGIADGGLTLRAAVNRKNRYVRLAPDSAELVLVYDAPEGLPPGDLDRVQDSRWMTAALSGLEAGHQLAEAYGGVNAMCPMGIPYFYGGQSEAKLLRRVYPERNLTSYYRSDRVYLYGFDCVGYLKWVLRHAMLAEPPSLSTLTRQGHGADLLPLDKPESWYLYLKPGDLIAVNHGGYHVLLYLGTLRHFGYTAETAGDAAAVLDAPLVLHCGNNPFYYERYASWIREERFPNTYPPDGGVTASIVLRSFKEAPRLVDSAWGKYYGWYDLNGTQVTVFPLSDCIQIGWYADPGA